MWRDPRCVRFGPITPIAVGTPRTVWHPMQAPCPCEKSCRPRAGSPASVTASPAGIGVFGTKCAGSFSTGKLTNPAGVSSQIMGVYAADLTTVLARALGRLGSSRAYVVHGMDGLDEITITDRTRVSELRDGAVNDYFIHPSDFDLPAGKAEDLKGGDAKANAALTIEVLKGAKGPKRDIVLLNAAAGLAASGRAKDLRDGIRIAAESIDSGAAMKKLEELKKFTNKT